jgi:hypothetical protein
LLIWFDFTVCSSVVVLRNLAGFWCTYGRCGHFHLPRPWGFLRLVTVFECIFSDFVMYLLDRSCCAVKVVHKAKSRACPWAVWHIGEVVGGCFPLILHRSVKLDEIWSIFERFLNYFIYDRYKWIRNLSVLNFHSLLVIWLSYSMLFG